MNWFSDAWRDLKSSISSAPHGIQILNAAGTVTFASTDVTWNQVDALYVRGGTTVTKNYPALLNREVLVTQMMINPPPIDRRAVAHSISVQGTTVTIGGGTEHSYGLVLMR